MSSNKILKFKKKTTSNDTPEPSGSSSVAPPKKLLLKRNKTVDLSTSQSEGNSESKESVPEETRTQQRQESISFDIGSNLKNLLQGHFDSELMVDMNPNTHELEFRIGEFKKSHGRGQVSFDAYVPRLQFNRMIKYYHEKYKMVKMEENINLDIIYDQNFRVTVGNENIVSSKNEIEFFCRTNKLRSPTFMEKVQIQKTDNMDWSYRVTSSQESPITNQTQQLKLTGAIEDKTVSKFYRYKYRYSYFPNDEIRIDFTIVKETPPGKTAGTLVSSRTLAQKEKFQVELEYIGNNFNIEHLSQTVKKDLLNLIRLYNGSKGSNMAISESHSNLILSRYIKLGLGINNMSPDEIHQKPTTSKFLAIDVEALTRLNFNRILNDYMVTVKADGEHYLLYCDRDYGFFLINNRLSVSPVTLNVPDKDQASISAFQEKIRSLGNCVFDGELVEYEGKSRFLIFDCFFFNDRDVRDFPLYVKETGKYVINEKSRIYYIKKLINVINNDILKDHLIIEEKSYYLINKVSRFFKRVGDTDKWVMNDDEFPYNIDGLIYMPINEPYPKTIVKGNKIIKPSRDTDRDNDGGNDGGRSPILKWKPPEFLSIDFRVKFDYENEQTPKVVKMNGKDYQVMTLESAYGGKISAFEPSCYRVKDYNKLYMPLEGGQPQLVEKEGYRSEESTLGHVIRNNDILEFVWVPDRSFGNDYWGIWWPIKYREDKTSNGFPNGYRVVSDTTWMAIHDQQVLPINLMDPFGEEYQSPQLDLGYYQNQNRDVAPELRNIHNGIKSVLLFLAIKQSGSNSRRLMDLATGRGGDLAKWAGVNYVFGIEYDESNIKMGDSSAYGRYRGMIESNQRNDRKPGFVMDLIQGDMKEPFGDNRVSNESIYNHIMKEKLGNNPESFGIISCQFAMHYACDTEEHLETFIRNISENLAPNGFFVATAFDGSRILADLQTTDKTDEDGQPLIIGKVDGKIMWSIASPVKYKKMESIGQKIIVFNKTIKDDTEVEYLVNFDYVLEVAKKYNLYPGKLTFGKHSLPSEGYGVGSFSEIYDEDYLKLVSSTTFPKGTPKFKELETSYQKIPLDIKKYSKYSSFLILRKQQQ
jgi:hypothetical protein